MAEETPVDDTAEKDTVDTPQEPTDDVEELKAALAKANKDAARHRQRNKELEPLAAKAKELEDAGKGELEKLTERLSEAEKKALSTESAALRLEVALDKAPDGLPASKIRALAKRLVGSNREELEADADELFAEFVPDGRTTVTRKPNERLRGGSEPDADPEPDAEKVADAVLSRR